MNIEEISKILPHRYPMLLVDKVLDIREGEFIKTQKNVTFNEPFFNGHFPGKPIMPGVLIIESVAQSAGILANKTLKNEKGGALMYFLGIEQAKFRQMVVPGDILIHHIKITQNRRNVCKFSSETFVEGKIVAEASISAMIEV